jgi:PadR family transcriptional regulator PadR
MPVGTPLLQGTLDLLILKALSVQALHGLGAARRIQAITNGTFHVTPGSLFPALHRLEDQGSLTSSWGPSEHNRRARYYQLTARGRRRLAAEHEDWARVAGAIQAAMEST